MSDKTTDPPTRIQLSGGDEYDVFCRSARHAHCYTQRAGVCQAVKRKYNRRLRHIVKMILRGRSADE